MFDVIGFLRGIKPVFYRRWLPILIVLLAAIVRFHALEVQSLWNDEGNSLRLAERPIPELLAAAAHDIHPPGYALALKAWTGVVGDTEFGLRALSAFGGIMAVAFSYALGKRLFAPGGGVMAAFFVAVNTFQVYYGQETRMYALLALWAVAALWAFVGWTARPNWRDGLLLALFNAAGLYTQYAYPAVMLTQGILVVILLVIRVRDGRPIRPLIIGFVALNLITLALFAPWLPTALRQIGGWPSTGQAVAPLSALGTLTQWFVYGKTALRVEPLAYLWPGIFLAAAFIPDWIRKRQPFGWRLALPILLLLVTLVPFFALGLYRDSNLKLLIPLQIAVALLIGRGAWLLWELGTPNFVVLIESLPRLFAIFGVMSMASTFGDSLTALYSNSTFARDDYREMARIISEKPRPADAIILDAPNQQEVFSYYYQGSAPVYPLPAGLGGDDEATRASIRQIIASHKRIFVLYWGESERDPGRIVEKELNAATFPALSRYFGDVRFVQYSVPSTSVPRGEQVFDARFGDVMTLSGITVDTRNVHQGDVLNLTLFWQSQKPIDKRYKIFIHLLNADGKIVTQRDSEPGNNLNPTTLWKPGVRIPDLHGLLIPLTLPAGKYRLSMGVYDLDQPTVRLPVNGTDAVDLGEITVVLAQ